MGWPLGSPLPQPRSPAAAFAGGAFNPAVGTGPTIVHAMLGGGTWVHLWLYWIAPLAGGATAAAVFTIQEAKSGRDIKA